MSQRKRELEQVRDLPDNELAAALATAQDELFRKRLGHYTNQIEDTSTIRAKRREVARIHTVMRARDLKLETQQAAPDPVDAGQEPQGKDE